MKQSPALIARIVAERALEYSVKAKVHNLDLLKGVVDNDAVLTGGLWLDPALALLSKTSKLSFHQKRLITLYMCDAVPTASLLNSWGYDVDSLCPL